LLGGRKVEDGKEEQKRQKGVDLRVDAILLNNNEIRELTGLAPTLNFVLPQSDPHNLLWLNLSYNFLVKIDPEILNFP
jgi:hypothetical protein